MSRTYLRNNLLLMVLSLFLSILLWSVVKGLNMPQGAPKQEAFDVPIVYRDPVQGLVRTAGPTSVRAIVEGTEEEVAAVDRKTVFGTVDLTEGIAGARSYPIALTAPPSQARIALDRRFAEVTLEQVVTEVRPIEITTRGSLRLERGMRMTSYNPQPDTVQVYGPRRFLQRVSVVRAVLNLADVAENKVLRSPLEVLDGDGKRVPFIRLDPVEVVVVVSIMPDVPEKQALVVPAFRGQPKFGFEVQGYEVTPNQVTIRGEFERLSSVFTVQTEPIDLTNIEAGRLVQAKLVVPSGLQVRGVDRVRVRVNVVRNANVGEPPGGPGPATVPLGGPDGSPTSARG